MACKTLNELPTGSILCGADGGPVTVLDVVPHPDRFDEQRVAVTVYAEAGGVLKGKFAEDGYDKFDGPATVECVYNVQHTDGGKAEKAQAKLAALGGFLPDADDYDAEAWMKVAFKDEPGSVYATVVGAKAGYVYVFVNTKGYPSYSLTEDAGRKKALSAEAFKKKFRAEAGAGV